MRYLNTWYKNSVCSYSIAIFLVLSSLVACHNRSPKNQGLLREGDILFQNLDCGALCEAIEAVTEGIDGKSFSHCAMLIKIDDRLQVVEAIGSKVQLTSIEEFCARSGDSLVRKNISIGRVKPEFQSLISKATLFAKEQINQPYDDSFLLDNGAWYCSELLYESFKSANKGQDFFLLEPMTFKDPETGVFFPAWVDYYNNLGADIPEGQLGLNPGSISRSDRIEIIKFGN